MPWDTTNAKVKLWVPLAEEIDARSCWRSVMSTYGANTASPAGVPGGVVVGATAVVEVVVGAAVVAGLAIVVVDGGGEDVPVEHTPPVSEQAMGDEPPPGPDTWKPSVVLAPGANIAFHEAFVAWAHEPLVVTTPFQELTSCWPGASSKSSCHDVTANGPVLVMVKCPL